MIRLMSRAAAAALFGAIAGAVALAAAFTIHPDLVFDMDRHLPRGIASGLYPAERAGELTFAWTAGRADVNLAGFSRESPWTCSVRLRGGRAEPTPQPVVQIAVDGLTVAGHTATNEFQDVEVTVPARPLKPGLTLSIASSTTVVPGPSDRRELGVQIDRVACRPGAGESGRRDSSGSWRLGVGSSVVLPPTRPLGAAMSAAAAFGAAAALSGATLGGAAGAAVVVAALQAFPLSSSPAPYGAFPGTAMQLALWLAVLAIALVRLLEAGTRRPLETAARFVVLFSACALYIKLLGLLHPSKLLIDALFHAHRFQSVMAGGYYFTQPMPGGVSFPYAIGLYLFAWPWSVLTRDYVALLRVVVSASEVIAGGLLYLMVARTWADRRIGALAVVLFNVVPLPYGLIGNANLTNAFGQSAALATVAAGVIWPLRRGRFVGVAGLFLLASLAFLSHISTAALLGVTLGAAALLYRTVGGPTLRRTAWSLLAVTAAAALFAIVTYYGHFTDVYRTLGRVRAAPAAVAAPQTDGAEAPAALATPSRAPAPLSRRIVHALGFTIGMVGWPIVILAVAGLWHLWKCGGRDPLTLMLGAWGIAYGTFLGVGILPRVDTSFERYAAEFIGRVIFATYPAAVLLAARAAVAGWKAGTLARVAVVPLVAWAAVTGLQQWARWLE